MISQSVVQGFVFGVVALYLVAWLLDHLLALGFIKNPRKQDLREGKVL